jgi:hypothetical protein
VVDGIVGSYFEWLGAGVYAADHRGGAMHGKRALLKEVLYGSDGSSIYLRVDFAEDASQLEELEIQVHPESGTSQLAVIRLQGGGAVMAGGVGDGASAAFREVLEIAVPMADGLNGVRLSFWQDGLPIQSVPQAGSFGSGFSEAEPQGG